MSKKESLKAFLLKAIKILVVLFTLSAIGWFISTLPFAQELPFIDPHKRLSVGVFLGAVISLLMLAAFFSFGAEAAPSVDALLEFLPGAGRLFGNLVNIGAFLFGYYAFQPSVFPFIPDYEWAYQSVFLGAILFFLARAGLIMHGASESLSRAIMGGFNPYKAAPAPAPAGEEKAGQAPAAPAVREEQPPT